MQKAFYPTNIDNAANHMMKPNKKFTFVNDEGSVSLFETDDRGFRKSSVAPCECKTVMVLGDSFTQALQVNAADTWVDDLTARLQKDGAAIQLLNAGFGGIGTQGEAVVFFRFAKTVRPAAVLLQFTSNDIRNNSAGWQDPETTLASFDAPWAPSSASAWLSENFPNAYFLVRHRRTPIKAALKLSRLWNRIAFAVQPTYMGYRFTDESFLTVERNGFANRFIVEDRPDTPGLSIYRKEYPKSLQFGVRATETLLKRIKRECDLLGIPLIALHLPMREAVYRDDLWPLLPGGGAAYQSDKPQKTLQEICARLGIPLIDLLAGFQARADRQLFWELDAHYNAQGNHLVAELAYPELKRLLSDL